MNWLLQTWRSSIGGKQMVGITGLLLVGFLVAHLLGNLLVFAGRDAINSYAESLKGLGPMLWVMRIGLLAVFVIHVGGAVRLNRANRAARPFGYAYEGTVQASVASRYMIWTGIAVGLFVLYHLAHFTFGWVDPDSFEVVETPADGEARHDVYRMVVTGFQHPGIVLLYVLAQAALFFHLAHGVASVAQTMGLNHPRYTPLVELIGKGVAAVIAGGNVAIAISIFLGMAPEPLTQL